MREIVGLYCGEFNIWIGVVDFGNYELLLSMF